MVHKDIHPVPEIDNELILFRELVRIPNKRSNPLVISQGGRIVQHLVEYSVMRNTNDYYSFGSTFGDFLRGLDYIPDDIKEIVFIIYNLRKDVVLSSKNIKFNDKEMLKFFKTFEAILNWFRMFYQKDIAEDGIFFEEMDETIDFLNDRINDQTTDDYEENNIYTNSARTMEDIEESLHTILPGFSEYIEHKMREALREQDQKWEEYYNTLRQNQETGLQNQGTIIQNQKNMDVKLDKIIDHLKELNNIIEGYQKEVESKLKDTLSAQEIESIMSEFIDDCIEKIQEYTENYTSTQLYKNEESRLEKSFGKEAWKKLSPKSKTFLTTSKFTYSRMESSDDIIDYSGVCLLVTKALEVELCERFYKGFGKYLKKECKKDYSKYHTSLLGYNKETKDYYLLTSKKKCDLGRITCILGYNDWGMNNEEYEHNLLKTIEYSSEHIFKKRKLNDKKIREKLLEYGEYVDDVRKDFRNPAAHTNELKKINAQECFDFVLDTEKILRKMLDCFDY